MNKPFISFALLVAAGVAGAVAGCSSADPGVNYNGTGHLDGTGGGSATSSGSGSSSGGGSSGGEDAGASSSGGTMDAGGTSSTGDSGTSVADSGGGGGDAGVASPFKGLSAYASKPVTTSAMTNHANNNVAAQTPTLDCLSCHSAAGPGAPFLAAGFVATQAGGTTGAPDVEVGVYASGTGGTAFSAHTDANGYFWINPPVNGVTGPFYGGVRQQTEVDMPVTQTMTDCQSSSCHGGATQGAVHYP